MVKSLLAIHAENAALPDLTLLLLANLDQLSERRLVSPVRHFNSLPSTATKLSEQEYINFVEAISELSEIKHGVIIIYECPHADAWRFRGGVFAYE